MFFFLLRLLMYRILLLLLPCAWVVFDPLNLTAISHCLNFKFFDMSFLLEVADHNFVLKSASFMNLGILNLMISAFNYSFSG